MANPDAILDGSGLSLDLIVQPDGTVTMKAAGEAIEVDGAGDVSAPQLVTDVSFLTGTGGQVVAAGPVATALRSAPTPCRRLTVKALTSNDDPLYVGLSTVTADDDNDTGGLPLEPGEFFTFGASDVADVFILGTAGEGCAFAYEL
jgi:hypothetical protein